MLRGTLRVLVLALALPQAFLLELSVQNSCSHTVWLATTPNSDHQPLPGGSIRVEPGATHVYQIPNGGWAGRFWPKINCNDGGEECEFGQSSPPCPSDGCQPPADTKAEFNFPSQPPSTDSWYDISLVDGYSLPMRIVPRGVDQGSCISTNCAMSLDACPQNEISGIGDLRVFRNGKVVGCLSPCKKWNYPPPYGLGKPETIEPGVHMCCPTPPIQPQQCSSGPVIQTAFVQSVHQNCPSAYSYAYDDAAGLHNCPGETSFDVTLCPNSEDKPCTEWGWKFYDGYDIQGGDLYPSPAGHRNDCQDICKRDSNCRSYSWFEGVCYLKSTQGPVVPKNEVYSATVC